MSYRGGPSTASHRVCLVGAGSISQTHADALHEVPNADVVAVCDIDGARAEGLARKLGVDNTFDSIDRLVASESCNYAHVLVPPDLHGDVTARLLDAGLGVLIEKPMTTSVKACEALQAQATKLGLPLGVNQNALFYPAYARVRAELDSQSLGRLQHLVLILTFSREALPSAAHWMFRQPENVVYESGAHPFSQVYDLAGPALSIETSASGLREVAADRRFFDTWQFAFQCERATAQVFLSYGGHNPMSELVAICQDGVLRADFDRNRFFRLEKSRWPKYVQPAHLGSTLLRRELSQDLTNLACGIGSLLRPAFRTDSYFTSMKNSIAAFHGGHGAERAAPDSQLGAAVVSMCAAASAGLFVEAPARRPAQGGRRPSGCDVAIIGGTGFIGQTLVRQMITDGLGVRIMARHTAQLPRLFDSRHVETVQGDIRDLAAIRRAIEGARWVVHLAHGGHFSWDNVEETMVEATRRVARACLANSVDRLVFAGSIASLYLGDPDVTITGQTPNDSRARERGPYEWGKACSEDALNRFFVEDGLPGCILRPGVVLGAGGTPFHSGFGTWEGDVHCIGWNGGTNPLPLVLASDVADAIMRALVLAPAVGKTYNVVGDVRLSARTCVAELAETLTRPLVFHPRHPAQLQFVRVSKWAIKTLTGRRNALPSYRTIKSMGCVAQFDCADIKEDLCWKPAIDRADFIRRGLHVYADAG